VRLALAYLRTSGKEMEALEGQDSLPVCVGESGSSYGNTAQKILARRSSGLPTGDARKLHSAARLAT
jgi:hypothetical protein